MKELQRDIEYLVSEELTRANKKNPLFHSDHEAFGVIDEEVREVINEVGLITANCTEFRDATYKDSVFDTKADAILRIKIAAVKCACEAVQVAAMCEKWVMTDEQEIELSKILAKEAIKYINENDLQPTCFKVIDIEEVMAGEQE